MRQRTDRGARGVYGRPMPVAAIAHLAAGLPAPRPAAPLRRQALLKAGALQQAVLNSADFSIIATDESGIIQLFNVGAERMLG